MYKIELNCSECDADFEAEWLFGDNVRCTHCKTLFETDWDTDGDDNIYGPWLAGKVEAGGA